MSKTHDILAECAWTRPDSYGGFSPDGQYCVLTVTRDSNALDRSNWAVARQLLADSAGLTDIPFSNGEDSAVYEWRASHWGCGWIEYLMVKPDAPESVLECAAEIISALADYPALSDDHWTELEWQECADYWESMSVRDRAATIRDSGSTASIFAARRDYIPDDNGAVYEWIRG